MNTAKQWMKAGRTLGLVLLTVQTVHAEPRQVTSPAATRCIGVAVYESAIKTQPRAACSRRQALRAIAAALDIPPATLSFHVAQLARAGLAEARQEGRFVFYAANYAAMDELIAFLTDNCCQGGGACLPKTAAAATSAKRRARAGVAA